VQANATQQRVAPPVDVPSGAKSRSAPARPPGLEAANNPDWALHFLARVSAKAIERKVLKSVRTWAYSQAQIDPLSLSGAISIPENKERDGVVQDVVSELVRNGKLASDAAQTWKDRWLLYRDCYVLGTVIIESKSAHQFVCNTMPSTIVKTLNVLQEAEPLWILLRLAALRVKAEFKNMSATRRDPDLEAVIFPKNLRGRDGAIEDRIDRVRHIQAIRSLMVRAKASSEASVDRGQDFRGLTRVPLDRGTDQSNHPDPRTKLENLRPALEFLARISWHPEIVEFIRALQTGSGAGKQFLTAMTMKSVSDAGKLADRVKEDSRIAWRFRAALKSGIDSIETLTPQERAALMLYAFEIAPEMRTSVEEGLEALGVMTTLLFVVSLPFGAVAVAVGVLDAVVQGSGAVVLFFLEVDEGHAESASIFEKEANRLSSGGRYLHVAVQGAGALLSAAGAFAAVKGVVVGAKGVRAVKGVVAATKGVRAGEEAAAAQIARTSAVRAVEGSVEQSIPDSVTKSLGSGSRGTRLEQKLTQRPPAVQGELDKPSFKLKPSEPSFKLEPDQPSFKLKPDEPTPKAPLKQPKPDSVAKRLSSAARKKPGEMSLEELRQSAKSDPAAADELWRRYRELPRRSLTKLANEGDETAKAVLRQKPEPNLWAERETLRHGPATDPEQFELLEQDIRNYRRQPGVPGRIDVPATPRLPQDPRGINSPVRGGTAASARTNIPDLEGRPFGGASELGIPTNLKGKPGTTGGTILRPANPIATDHAEQVALENLRVAIEANAKNKGISGNELTRGKKVWLLVEQEPCSSCASGIETENIAGPLKAFSQLYPDLALEVKDLRSSRRLLLRNGQTP